MIYYRFVGLQSKVFTTECSGAKKDNIYDQNKK